MTVLLGGECGFTSAITPGFYGWRFKELLGDTTQFAQDNHARSDKGVLRGLSYQKGFRGKTCIPLL